MIPQDPLTPILLGSTSAGSQYTVNNVAERDLLRTEGDPGAVGYTIKEAVALTRSVVSLDVLPVTLFGPLVLLTCNEGLVALLASF